MSYSTKFWKLLEKAKKRGVDWHGLPRWADEAGAAVYREKIEAHKKGLCRQDREVAMRFVSELGPLSSEVLRALATSLLHEMPRIEMHHPFGVWHKNWNYEPGATSKAREILGLELQTGTRGVHYLNGDGFKALDSVSDADLRELVDDLMTHHLRIVGRIDRVSRGTRAPATAV